MPKWYNRYAKTKIKALHVLVFLLIINFTYASNVRFTNINDTYGTSIRETNSICKDTNGFIWVSAKTGVLRLCANNYRVYQLPYETHNVISVKLEYCNSNIYAATNNGQIFKYSQFYDRYEPIINIAKQINNQYLTFTRLLVDNNNAVWLATSLGLFNYYNNKLTRVLPDSINVLQAEWHNNHELFILTPGNLFLFDIKTGKLTNLIKNNNAQNFIASSLYFDKKNNMLWIGTMSGVLFYYKTKTNELKTINQSIIPQQPISAIENISDTSLMLGIDGQGIWEINKYTQKILNVYTDNPDDPLSLKGNGIYDIYNDNNRIWVCTYTGGASYFDLATPVITQITHKFNNKNSLINNNVNSIANDNYGNIWFATNNGVSCYNIKSDKWTTLLNKNTDQANVFLTLCADNNGCMWAGSYSSGTNVIDIKTKKSIAHYWSNSQPLSINNNFVFDIYTDTDNIIWVVGINGVITSYNPVTKQFNNYSVQPVNVITGYLPNKMLLGCSYGLSVLDKSTGNITNLIEGVIVHDLLFSDTTIWVATSGNGLLRYNIKTGKYLKFGLNTGLPSNFVNSIILDNNYLWIGTESGLCKFNTTNNSVQISAINGLGGYSFNPRACSKLKSGHLIWGTNNGAVQFLPAEIQQQQYNGKIYLQDLLIAGRSVRDSSLLIINKPVDSLQHIELNYNQNNITLELIGLGNSAQGAKFSWKMDGYDQVWSQPSPNNIINYNNLPGGNYTLNIKMYNNPQSHVISQRKVNFTIVPPFWKTVWFKIVLFIILSIIIFSILIFYRNSLEKIHSDEKIRFFANTTHDIRTLLTLITAPIEELGKEPSLSELGSYYLQLAGKQVKQMSAIATQLLDFQKADIEKERTNLQMVDIVEFIGDQVQIFEPYASTKNITVNFCSTINKFETAIDIFMAGKIVTNLLSNAVKYSETNSTIIVSLKFAKNTWELQVKDHGIGIDKKALRKLFREFYRAENAINAKISGSGIGLLLVKNYVKMHGGKITCQSAINTGTTFTITVPVKTITGVSGDKGHKNDTNIYETALSGPDDITESKELKILIVEDNDDLRNFMKYPLKDFFTVYTAVDGSKAWELINNEMPDLIVSDIMMPNIDGFELCKLVKSTYETSHIPVILLTALSEKTDQLHGLGLGADDYLVKPFDMTLLAQKIKTIIHNREIIREKALKLIKRSTHEPILSNELNDKFLKDALDVVMVHIMEPKFGKDEFASELNVSPSLLFKKLKTLTNQSPTDFIKTIRLNKAVELIETGKYTITEVSELCGFSNICYFSTVFKKHFGKSPTDINC